LFDADHLGAGFVVMVALGMTTEEMPAWDVADDLGNTPFRLDPNAPELRSFQ
jgi:hypothetical protein